MLATLSRIYLATFVLILKPMQVFGDKSSQRFRRNRNETIPLSMSLPLSDSDYDDDFVRRGLLWQGLSVLTSDSREYLLHPCSGFVPNGQVCGVLGPSGAGKTTLLSVIAGRPESSLYIFGQVLHYYVQQDGAETKSDEMRVRCASVLPGSVAWLQQHDAFFEHLTVKETLDLATYLELPHLPASRRDEIAKSCLESLGLSSLVSRPIGSNKASKVSNGASLSGGELRRLSVAVELVTQPHLFIADEPTSGIDSKMAENVMSTIVKMARDRQIPCFCTMHQPRSSIWHMLDSVILMAPGGKVCYIGSRKDAVHYFASLGHDCPPETNPAEFLIDLVSIDPENQVQALKDQQRINKLAYEFLAYTSKKSGTWRAEKDRLSEDPVRSLDAFEVTAKCHPFRIVRRFGALFRRSLRQNIRSTALNIFRLFLSTGTAMLLSQIFPSIAKGEDPKPKSVVDRVALLSFGVINMCMAAVMKTMDVFSKEKPVVQREQRRHLYSNFEYLLSKSLAEVPLDVLFAVFFTSALKTTTGLTISWKDITVTFSLMTIAGASLGFLIGSITPSQEAATSTGIPILIIMMIVGVINPSGVDPAQPKPVLIKWIEQVSPIASAIKALVMAEFTDMEFEAKKTRFGLRGLRRFFERLREAAQLGGVALVKNGDEVLDALGLKNAKYAEILQHMALLSLLNFCLCWLSLHFSGKHLVGRIKKSFRERFIKPRYGGGLQRNGTLSNEQAPEGRLSFSESLEDRKPFAAPFYAKF